MPQSANSKFRNPQFQCLEQRQMLTANFSMSMSYFAPATTGSNLAYVAESNSNVDESIKTNHVVEQIDNLPAQNDPPLMEQVTPEELAAEHGLGVGGESFVQEAVEEVASNNGPVGGSVDSDGFGPQGYQSTLDGANAQDNGKGGQTHDIPIVKENGPTLKDKALSGYGKTLNIQGKSQFMVEKACVSLDPAEYQQNDDDADSGNTSGPSALGTVKHGKLKAGSSGSGGNNGGTQTPSESKPSEEKAEKKEDENDKPTDGGTPDAGGTPSDAGNDDEPAAGTPDEEVDGGTPDDAGSPDSPDYDEGYVDPTDPSMQVWADFTNDYFWSKFNANQGGNVTPDPNSDGGAYAEVSLGDPRVWVDGATSSLPDEIPDGPSLTDSGDIDPVDEH